MMKTTVHSFAAIVAGLSLAFVLIVAVELFSAVVHPFPEDFGGTHQEIRQHVERYPNWVLAVVIPAWASTAFVGVWITKRIGNLLSSLVVGLLLLIALVCNVSMLPYPIWFKIVNLIAVPAAMLAAMGWPRHKMTASQETGAEQ